MANYSRRPEREKSGWSVRWSFALSSSNGCWTSVCLGGKSRIRILYLIIDDYHEFLFILKDNDHGQQGNGSITVNRRPTLVQGLEGIKITRVACGSSHSVAWTAPEPPSVIPPEPVPFPTVKDPLGSTAAGKHIL